MLAAMFNSHCINIAEKTSGKKPSHFAPDNNVSDTKQAIDLIVQPYLITTLTTFSKIYEIVTNW